LYRSDKKIAAQLTRDAENTQDHPRKISSVAAALALDPRIRERAENFPVALRVLPARYRDPLHAAYALARRIDDVGDDPARSPVQRLDDLDALDAELRAGWDDRTPALPIEPFLDLLAANRADQTLTRIPAYDDLLAYCRLSANPIGRVVLAVFGADRPESVALSDDVCTALQILEHCQDVGEDRRDRDRVYLPADDLDRYGVSDEHLLAATTSRELRRVVAVEVDRANALLDSGGALVRRLTGWARVAVAGYVAGGRATVDALRRCDFDVLGVDASPRRRDIARHALRLLAVRR
jgi:squalene synthase HpnC